MVGNSDPEGKAFQDIPSLPDGLDRVQDPLTVVQTESLHLLQVCHRNVSAS